MLVLFKITITIIDAALQVGHSYEEQSGFEAWATNVSEELIYRLGNGKYLYVREKLGRTRS